MNPDKLANSTTTDGKPPRPGLETAGAPAPIKENGQHEAYWVLSEEERRKGFIRPVRRTYLHAGTRPKYPTRDLTPHEAELYKDCKYVAFEAYPDSNESSLSGRYWTKEQLESGCGSATSMGASIAETYARDPSYYGATFCCKCAKHLPVGTNGEFIWEDGTRVGA